MRNNKGVESFVSGHSRRPDVAASKSSPQKAFNLFPFHLDLFLPQDGRQRTAPRRCRLLCRQQRQRLVLREVRR